MIALPSQIAMTPEEYLEFERHSEIKHEYIDGEIYAMAGTNKAHNIISLNLALLLREKLRSSPCQTFMADIKVATNHQKRFFYPDLVVTCDDNQDLTTYTVEFPKLIIEILSESTETFDRGRKFHYYRTIPSLQEYVLVSSQEYLVEVFRRTENDLWILQTYENLTDNVTLESLAVQLPLTEIYATLQLAPVPATNVENSPHSPTENRP
ncbi:MAG: Uma2 family endonuclease [Merismopediaceae bacterium]|nr:Uma2 family endonuclease [Merismopediaceae bacterium]